MPILLHPTRATRDLPHIGLRKGDRMYHVLSDLLGRAGSDELRTFVRGCGMRPEWVQYRGTYREHYDAHGALVDCLRLRGARVVGNHEVGALLRAKRAAADQPALAPEPAPRVEVLEPEDDVSAGEAGSGFHWGPVAGVPDERDLGALGDVAGRDVLELGCGSGTRALALVRWGARYTGLDDAPGRVEAARLRLEQAGAPGEVVLGSLDDLAPLVGARYDIVFSAGGALDRVPHLPAALAAVARVLRPGGRCVIMAVSPFFDAFPLDAPDDHSLFPTRSYFDRTPRRIPGTRHLRYHRTVGDWIAAFGAAGLLVTDALELEPHPRWWQPGAGPAQPRWEQVAMLPYTMIWRARKPG